MKKLFGVILVLVLAGLAYLNWDRIAPVLGPILGMQSSTPAAVATVSLGPAPDTLWRLALIDGTTSTDTTFRESMKAQLTAAVSGLVPAKPTALQAGVAGIAGLELTVRLVATNSLAYGEPNYVVSIPGVPALPPRPDMTVAGALDPDGPYDLWTDAAEEWSDQYDAAIAAAEAGAATLQSIDLSRDEYSGISAGMAALALLAPAGGDVAFAVFSDLDENRPPQPATFNGHPLLIVQPDNTGDVATWNALYDSFSAWATAGGAGELTRLRPEAAAPAITAFITGATP